MDQFPSNSNFEQTRREPKVKAEAKPEKKVESVVTGRVLRKKTSLGRRFLNTFVAGDGQGVWHYVLLDVVVPAVKDVIADAVSQGVERMIFGEARSTSRRTGQRPSGSSGYVSYNRFSSPRRDTVSSPILSRQARATHNFDEIILATRAEAGEVIDRLVELVAQYEQATLGDLYSLIGVTGEFTDEKWGWVDLETAGIRRVSGGYLLVLPRPQALD